MKELWSFFPSDNIVVMLKRGKPCLLEMQNEIFKDKMICCLEFTSKSSEEEKKRSNDIGHSCRWLKLGDERLGVSYTVFSTTVHVWNFP